MSPSQKVVLVSGANRGIGKAIIESLAGHPHTSTWTLVLGCRDPEKGRQAIEDLSTRVNAAMYTIGMDVSSDDSICKAVAEVDSRFGRLDVLVNNAGYAQISRAEDGSDIRDSYMSTLNINVASVAVATAFFLPLLRRSGSGAKVINISSARGSLARSASGQLPPTAVAAYSVSKTALNAMTVEMSRQAENQAVEFQLACPGHCKTQFNGFRGSRDPVEGAIVVTELIVCDRTKTGCWETHGSSRELVEVPW